MIPEYYDKYDVAVFTTDQLDTFGLPEENGFEETYWVVESKQFETFNNDSENFEKVIHKYSRTDRFRTCFLQLIGKIGVIGKNYHLINEIVYQEFTSVEKHYLPECLQWEFFRKILKKHKLNAFYNRIPAIAKNFGFNLKLPIVSSRLVNVICKDFEAMNDIFPRIRHKLTRKYFPSIRAICLMLMERYKIPNVLDIPIARTAQKTFELRQCFDEIWEFINEELTNYFFE